MITPNLLNMPRPIRPVRGVAVEESSVKLGDYVLATRWGDCGPSDPWAVGFVSEVGAHYVLIDGVGHRAYRYILPISGEAGSWIVRDYPSYEGDDEAPGLKWLATTLAAYPNM